MRRLICKCLARQDRALWDEFCTSLLPDDADAFAAAKAEAEEAVDQCKSAVSEADDAGTAEGGNLFVALIPLYVVLVGGVLVPYLVCAGSPLGW